MVDTIIAFIIKTFVFMNYGLTDPIGNFLVGAILFFVPSTNAKKYKFNEYL